MVAYVNTSQTIFRGRIEWQSLPSAGSRHLLGYTLIWRKWS